MTIKSEIKEVDINSLYEELSVCIQFENYYRERKEEVLKEIKRWTGVSGAVIKSGVKLPAINKDTKKEKDS